MKPPFLDFYASVLWRNIMAGNGEPMMPSIFCIYCRAGERMPVPRTKDKDKDKGSSIGRWLETGSNSKENALALLALAIKSVAY